MHVYRELTSPTTVTHSTPCRLGGVNCLAIVRGGSLLQIYRTETIRRETIAPVAPADQDSRVPTEAGEESFIGTELQLQTTTEEEIPKLVLRAEFPLDGKVTAISRTRVGASAPDDFLVVAFKYAKIVLLEWDATSSGLAPVSVHYYEKGIWDEHFFDKEYEPVMVTDPQNGCVALMYQRDKIAFLPFQKEDVYDTAEGDDTILGALDPAAVNGTMEAEAETLKPVFEPSFVLGASALDEQVENTIGMTFLDEYIEPTLAMLYCDEPSWTGTLPLRRDTTKYVVISLDLAKKTSTSIIHVKKLPYDLHSVFALPAPIGGALLVGTNHLVHVDSAGKTLGVAVNAYSKLITNLALRDASDLDLQLEGARLAHVDGRDALLVLQNGELWNVRFNIEGRKVFGFSLERAKTVGTITVPNPVSFSAVGERGMFVGSSTSDSKLLTWVRGGRTAAGGKVPVARDDGSAAAGAAAAEDDLDDIYDEPEEENGTASTSDQMLEYGMADELLCYGPIHNICVGQRFDSKEHELVAATGVGDTAGLTVFHNSVKPIVHSSIEFGLSTEEVDIKTENDENGDVAHEPVKKEDSQEHIKEEEDRDEMAVDEPTINRNVTQKPNPRLWTLAPMSAIETRDGDALHRYVVSYDGKQTSKLYKITHRMEDATDTTDFMSEAATVQIATALGDLVVVHVHEGGMALYDHEFARIKHIKLPAKAKSADIVGSRIFVHFVNGHYGLYLTKYGANGKPTFEKLRVPAKLPQTLVAGSLALTSIMSRAARKKRKRDSSEIKAEVTYSPVCVGLTDTELVVFSIVDPENVYTFKGVHGLAPVLASEDETAPKDTVQFSSVLLAHLGDNLHQEPYLALMGTDGEMQLYRAFSHEGKPRFALCQGFRGALPVDRGSRLPQTLSRVSVGPYRAIITTGDVPLLVVKGAKSTPKVHRLRAEAVLSVASYNSESVYRGLLVLDEKGTGKICGLDVTFDLTSSLPAKRVCLGENTTHVTYHAATQTYAIAVMHDAPYAAIDEDDNPLPFLREGVPKAHSYKSTLRLVSPMNWSVIDSIELPDDEVIFSLKSVLLEVSEKTKRRREYLAFGTSVLRGEDSQSKGNYYVAEVIEIVPEPGRPEASRRLKEVAKENVRGAVTALCEVSGCLLTTQGQKIIVRNIQEDNSVIPVAFLDVQVYVSDVKAVKNLVLVSDRLQGTWLAGFGVEPFRMAIVAKELRNLEVDAADFVLYDGALYPVLVDAQQTLHLLQYDPEDSASSGGQKLLSRAQFFTGRTASSIVSVPTAEDAPGTLQPIIACRDGVISTIVPVSEQTYRSLFVLHQQILEKEEHTACLNPRMHRVTGQPFHQQTAGRGLLDYALISRFRTLPVSRRRQYARKVGKAGESLVWDDMALIENTLAFL